jgi:alpha-L-rhamnosidase
MGKSRFLYGLILLAIFIQDGISQDNFRLTYPAKFNIEYIAPVLVEKTGSDSWFIDFGKDAFGTLVLNLNADKADTLIIQLGEKLSSPKVIDSNPGGTIRYQKIKLAVNPEVKHYELKLPADKRNSNPPAVALPPQFGVITPFRYCEIGNLKTNLAKDNIKQKALFYAFDENASSFTCSDTILNKIWDICKYSIKATSFCGLYIDGDRERIPYEGDALINQLSHYAVDDEYSLARRTNEYFMSHPTWPTEWILHTVILFYYDYLYTGDPTLLTMYYEALKAKTLIDLEREDGLISVKSEKLNDDLMTRLGFKDNKQRLRDIVDWPPAQKDTGWKLVNTEGERDGYELVDINTVVNAFHYYNLKLMSEMAGWLGKNEDSRFFLKRSQLVKESINSKLFDSKKGIYLDGENSDHSSLHANMFPLAFGIVPEKNITTVVTFIKSRGMACSVYGSQHLLDGLYGAGESDYALELLTSVSDRSWWNMIRSGSTITLEAWDMKYKPNSDWNHAWGAAPANIISRQLWGIRPVQPGFSQAVINPQMGRLASSAITVPTIKGFIKASFKKTNTNADVYSIDIPPGINADFVIPQKEFRSVLVDNKNTVPEKGSVKLKPGHYNIEIVY